MAFGLVYEMATAVLAASPAQEFRALVSEGLLSGTLYWSWRGLRLPDGRPAHEQIDPETEGRQVSRMYRISPQGAQTARMELAALSVGGTAASALEDQTAGSRGWRYVSPPGIRETPRVWPGPGLRWWPTALKDAHYTNKSNMIYIYISINSGT
jgi:hypothetical protein